MQDFFEYHVDGRGLLRLWELEDKSEMQKLSNYDLIVNNS